MLRDFCSAPRSVVEIRSAAICNRVQLGRGDERQGLGGLRRVL
jgi:hypothetical protein